jgi:HK97 family phage prohead protease
METKTYPLQELKADEEAPGTFQGYLSIFGNRDAQGHSVQPGAFRRTLKHQKGRVPLLWQHDIHTPIGQLALAEDEKGLRVEKGAIDLEVAEGQRAYSGLQKGYLTDLSIGWEPVKDKYDKETDTLELIEIKLWEGSIVTFGANPLATVSEVKQAIARKLKEYCRLQRLEPTTDLDSFAETLLKALHSRPTEPDLTKAFDWLTGGPAPSNDDAVAVESHFDWMKEITP